MRDDLLRYREALAQSTGLDLDAPAPDARSHLEQLGFDTRTYQERRRGPQRPPPAAVEEPVDVPPSQPERRRMADVGQPQRRRGGLLDPLARLHARAMPPPDGGAQRGGQAPGLGLRRETARRTPDGQRAQGRQQPAPPPTTPEPEPDINWVQGAEQRIRELPEGEERRTLERRVAREATGEKSGPRNAIEALHAAGAIDEGIDAGPKRKSRGAIEDIPLAAAEGVVSAVESLVGVASMVTEGRAGRAIERRGMHPARARKLIRGLYSEKTQNALEEFERAEDLQEAALAVVRNPRLIGKSIVETVPLMLSGTAIGRGLMWAAPKVHRVLQPAAELARKAAKSKAVAQAAPTRRVAAAGRRIARTPSGAPALSPRWAAAAGEGAVGAGLTAESIRQDPASGGLLTPAQTALAAGAGAATAGIARVASGVAARFGARDVEELLVQARTSPATRVQVAKAIVAGAVSEGVLEELPQTISETVAENVATGREALDGAAQNAVLATVTGFAMGGGANAATAVAHTNPKEWADELRLVTRKLLPSTQGRLPAADFWQRIQTDHESALEDEVTSVPDKHLWERYTALLDEGYSQLAKWQMNPLQVVAEAADTGVEGAAATEPGEVTVPPAGMTGGEQPPPLTTPGEQRLEEGAQAAGPGTERAPDAVPAPSDVMRAGEAQREAQAGAVGVNADVLQLPTPAPSPVPQRTLREMIAEAERPGGPVQQGLDTFLADEPAPKTPGYSAETFRENLAKLPEQVEYEGDKPRVAAPIPIPEELQGRGKRDAWRYVREAREQVGDKTTDETVDIDSLISHQETLDPETLRRIADEGLDLERPLAKVVDWNGQPLIYDGNHRVAIAKLGGARRVKVSRLQTPKPPKVKAGPSPDDPDEVGAATFDMYRVGKRETVPIDDLAGGVREDAPEERERVAELAEKIRESGRFDRLLVDDEGDVLEGQHRLSAARRLGLKRVPVQRIQDLGRDLPVSEMQDAAAAAANLHPQQARQIVEYIAEEISDSGSVQAARENLVGGQLQPAYDAAFDAAEKAGLADMPAAPPAGKGTTRRPPTPPAPAPPAARRPPARPEPTSTPDGRSIYGIEVPELVGLAQDLGAKLQVKGMPRFSGLFRPKAEGMPQILLNPEMWKEGTTAVARTLAHEIGHLVDWLPNRELKRGNLLGRLMSLRKHIRKTLVAPDGAAFKDAEIREELRAWSKHWREWPDDAEPAYHKYRNKGEELYADALSGLLNDPSAVKQIAPKFVDLFFRGLGRKPSVDKAYFELMDVLGGSREAVIEARMARTDAWAKAFDTGLEAQAQVLSDLRKRKRRWLSQYVFDEAVDQHGPLLRRIEKTIKERGEGDPEVRDLVELRAMLGERNYSSGKLWGFLQGTYKPAKETTIDADVDWKKVHQFMLYDRIRATAPVPGADPTPGETEATEPDSPEDVPNPQGLSGQDAQEAIDHIERQLGPERFRALQQAVDHIRDGTAETVDLAVESGIWSQELGDRLKENREYATYQAYDHLDKPVRAAIRARTGYLGGVRNTADATMHKMLVVRAAAYRNQIKRDAINYLLKDEQPSEFPGIVRGVVEGGGKFQRISPPPTMKAPQDYTLVEYKEDGESKGVYMRDPELVRAVENAREGELFEALGILNKVQQNWVTPLVITLNAAFQAHNTLFRDPGQTFRALGTVAGQKKSFHLTRAYVNAWRMAYVRAFNGRPTWARNEKKWAEAEQDALDGFRSGIYNAGGFNQYMAGVSKEESLLDEFNEQFALTPEEADRRANIAVRALKGAWKVANNISTFGESLGKAAGIKAMQMATGKEVADLPAEARDFIRTSLGSPDFYARGRHTQSLRALWMFINPIVQSHRTNARLAFRKQAGEVISSRAGWWRRLGSHIILPKVMMYAAAVGSPALMRLIARGVGADEEEAEEIGERFTRFYAQIPDYYKHNYVVVPIGNDEYNNVVFATIPQDDIGKSVGSVVWGALNALPRDQGETMLGEVLPRIMDTVTDYAADSTPSKNSVLSISGVWWDYLQGQNPTDPLFNRTILTQTENEARNWRTRAKLLKWTINQSGLSTVWQLPIFRGPQMPETGFQKFRRTPFIGRVTGSFIRVAPPGSDRYNRAIDEVARDKARQRDDEDVFITEATEGIFQQAPRLRARMVPQQARKIAAALYGNVSRRERAERQAAIQRRLQMNVRMGWNDPTSAAIMRAGSEDAKVRILQMAADEREGLGRRQFFEHWLPAARRSGVVSKDLYAAYRRAERTGQ